MSKTFGLIETLKLILKNADIPITKDMFMLSSSANGEAEYKTIEYVKSILNIDFNSDLFVEKQTLEITIQNGEVDYTPSIINSELNNVKGLYSAKVHVYQHLNYPAVINYYSDGFIIGINGYSDTNIQFRSFQLYFNANDKLLWYRTATDDETAWNPWYAITISSLLQLPDVLPDTYIGNAKKVLGVNETEDGIIFVDITTKQNMSFIIKGIAILGSNATVPLIVTEDDKKLTTAIININIDNRIETDNPVTFSILVNGIALTQTLTIPYNQTYLYTTFTTPKSVNTGDIISISCDSAGSGHIEDITIQLVIS